MGKRLEIKAGDPFGRWTVLEEAEPVINSYGYPVRRFKCRCECGTVRNVFLSSLTNGTSTQCKMCQGRDASERHRKQIVQGEKYGDWVVLGASTPCIRKGAQYVQAKCKCGRVFDVSLKSLKNGESKKCHYCASTKHGFHGTPLETIYNSMYDRCYSPKCPAYKNYGGRGIKICDEWLRDRTKFYQFAIDNGWKRGLETDRKDNDGDYEPSNVHFITRRENGWNKRNTRKSAEGIPLAKIYAEASNPTVTYGTFATRVARFGWDVNEALTTPARNRGVE